MLRDRIRATYGADCVVLTTRRAESGGAFWFVVDVVLRARPLRLLGSIDRSNAVMEHSAMDLLHPERLVFLYERLMLAAFALAPRPEKALLLGLGGGAMCRHLAAHLPECSLTVVERDAGVVDLARRFFHLAEPILQADAEAVAADSAGAFDIVLVDLYDPRGIAALQPGFWRDCSRALKPEGCLAINWAGFLVVPRVREEIAGAAAELPKSIFVVDRGARPNMVQLVPAAGLRLADLDGRLRSFARRRRLPAEDRDVLRKCRVLARPPPGPR